MRRKGQAPFSRRHPTTHTNANGNEKFNGSGIGGGGTAGNLTNLHIGSGDGDAEFGGTGIGGTDNNYLFNQMHRNLNDAMNITTKTFIQKQGSIESGGGVIASNTSIGTGYRPSHENIPMRPLLINGVRGGRGGGGGSGVGVAAAAGGGGNDERNLSLYE